MEPQVGNGAAESAAVMSQAKTLGIDAALSAFDTSKTRDDRVHRGIELLARIAEVSGLATTNSEDSYYAQEILVQRLAGVKQALAELDDTLSGAPSANDEVSLAMNYAVLVRTGYKLNSSLRILASADTTGDVGRELDNAPARFSAQIDDIAAR